MQDVRIRELTAAWQELYQAALQAREQAYIPYSRFAVGAAVRTASGSVYSGCNIENASYGLCTCGERSAIFNAVSSGERELQQLCVVAATSAPVSPCGACRQVMREFALREILLANLEGAGKLCTMEELLPYGFEL